MFRKQIIIVCRVHPGSKHVRICLSKTVHVKMIQLECVGVLADDLNISLEVDGVSIACLSRRQWQAARGLTLCQLTPVQPLSADIESLSLCMSAQTKIKDIYINRIIFSAEPDIMCGDASQ